MFVMSYFRTESEALHLAISEDGLEWTALNGNRPLLHSTVGAQRARPAHQPVARRQWTSITERMTFPPGPRHSSVLQVDEASADDLRRAI